MFPICADEHGTAVGRVLEGDDVGDAFGKGGGVVGLEVFEDILFPDVVIDAKSDIWTAGVDVGVLKGGGASVDDDFERVVTAHVFDKLETQHKLERRADLGVVAGVDEFGALERKGEGGRERETERRTSQVRHSLVPR